MQNITIKRILLLTRKIIFICLTILGLYILVSVAGFRIIANKDHQYYIVSYPDFTSINFPSMDYDIKMIVYDTNIKDSQILGKTSRKYIRSVIWDDMNDVVIIEEQVYNYTNLNGKWAKEPLHIYRGGRKY